jgi:hypothetical protein
MVYNLDLYVRIEGTGILRFNQFRCRSEDLPGITAKWVCQVWREHGCRDMKVERVMANEEDIKKDVMKEKMPPTIM